MLDLPAAQEPSLNVVRSEERLIVSTTQFAARKITLRKRVVSETRVIEVTLLREELVIEEVPLPGTQSGGSPSAVEPIVMILHQQFPVVSVTTEPYERVTLTVAKVIEQKAINTTLASEQVDLEPARPTLGPRTSRSN